MTLDYLTTARWEIKKGGWGYAAAAAAHVGKCGKLAGLAGTLLTTKVSHRLGPPLDALHFNGYL